MSKEENYQEYVNWLESVVENYTLKMRKYIWYITGDRQLIDDLYQDAFEKIIKYAPKLMEMSDRELNGYIRTIVRTVIADYYRKLQKNPTCVSGDWERLCEDKNAHSGPENYILRKEYSHLLDILPEQTKEIMCLRIVYSMPYEMIGKRMNISTASARKKYERGKKKLLERLEQEELYNQWNITVALF